MTALLLASLVLSAPLPGGGRAPLDVRVTATDAAGRADASLTKALAQALMDAGLPAAAEHGPSGDCRDECVRVSVRKTEDRRFLIEVRGRGDPAQQPVRVDPNASSFDQVHALAIEVEALAEGMRPLRRRRARPPVVASSRPQPAPAPSADAADGERAPSAPVTSPEPPTATRERDERDERDDDGAAAPPVAPAGRAVPAVQEHAPPDAAPADERVALNVAAMVLASPSGDLLMHGSTLGIRLRLTHRLDARASIAFLRPENIDQQGTSYRLELLPLAAAVALEVPRVPALRVGGGVEGVLLSGDRVGREGPSYWAIGPIARLEVRYAIRSFALMGSLQGALHPASWNTARDDFGPQVAIPRWTLGAALGLELKVF